MVSALNDFACVLPVHYCSHNICHILCTCIYLYEYSWLDRLLGDEKRFSHWLQEYKCSPVCLLLWTVKFCFVVNRLSQTVQRYCFSPSFVLLWSFKLLLVRISSDEFPVRVQITDKHWQLTMADQVYRLGASWHEYQIFDLKTACFGGFWGTKRNSCRKPMSKCPLCHGNISVRLSVRLSVLFHRLITCQNN